MYSRLSTKSNRFYWFISPTPVFLPGEFHGQRSLPGYSPLGHKESDTTEWLSLTHSINYASGIQNAVKLEKKKKKTAKHCHICFLISEFSSGEEQKFGKQGGRLQHGQPLRHWAPSMAQTSRAGLWWAWPQLTTFSDAPGCRWQAPAWNQSILLKTMPQRYVNTETLYLSLEINFSLENHTAVLCVC